MRTWGGNAVRSCRRKRALGALAAPRRAVAGIAAGARQDGAADRAGAWRRSAGGAATGGLSACPAALRAIDLRAPRAVPLVGPYRGLARQLVVDGSAAALTRPGRIPVARHSEESLAVGAGHAKGIPAKLAVDVRGRVERAPAVPARLGVRAGGIPEGDPLGMRERADPRQRGE